VSDAASAEDAIPAGEAPRRGRIGRIVNDPRLRRSQHRHSAAVTVAGLAGIVAAALLTLAGRPISALDLGLFAGFFLAIGLGVTVGFHRHFTHRAFKATPATRAALAILGCMAAQGPVVFWVALHRLHHEFADRPGDPHSPNLAGGSFRQRAKGLLHAYIGWTMRHEVPNANFYARDLLTDRRLMWINRRYYRWVALGLALPTALGGLIAGSSMGAAEGLIWGGLIRLFAVHNIIWWITSLAHVAGHRDYLCGDRSTNNLWIALPTLGEGWHNNHHSFPSAAVLRFEWWQIDLSGMVIRLLERCGLAWDVNAPTHAALAARRRQGASAGEEKHRWTA
jgi:stearoyl-CoA desaturase (Delta-9 desaturase)